MSAARGQTAPPQVRVSIERVVASGPAGGGLPARIAATLPAAIESRLAGERLPPHVAHAVAAEVAGAVERAAREAAP
jgi:hypothetical protein